MGRQRTTMSLAAPGKIIRNSTPRRTMAGLFAVAALAAVSATTSVVGTAEARQSSRQHNSAQAAPRGEVFLNGRWVSSAWCDATVPGPDGGPGGPGRGLCDASTPRR